MSEIKTNIIKKYEAANIYHRVDIICSNYNNFLGIIEGYTEGLCYMIMNERRKNLQDNFDLLGVRIQKSGVCNDSTANEAINSVMIKKAIKECDFSGGFFEGIEEKERIREIAKTLQLMRLDFHLFNHQLNVLDKQEGCIFLDYLHRNKDLMEIAEEHGIQYESARQKIRRIKKKMKNQMESFLGE